MTDNTAIIAQLKVNRAFLVEHYNTQSRSITSKSSDDAITDMLLIGENIQEIDEQLTHYMNPPKSMKTRLVRMLKAHITNKF